MAVRYTRLFKPGDSGVDVEAVGRALARARIRKNTKISAFRFMPKRVRRKWNKRKRQDLRRFKMKHHLHADSQYTKHAHEVLSKHFDAKARKLMNAWEKPIPADVRHWQALLEAARDVHRNTPGYDYGGSHGTPLSRLDSKDWFDCSSSCSFILYKAGMWGEGRYALTSGEFARSWGRPGRGKYFTVYANNGHVWIRLHKGPYWRFDTGGGYDARSPRGGGRLRYVPRFTWGFTARHWPGM